MGVLSQPHVHCSSHRRGLSRRLWTGKDEFLDSGDLFTVIVFLENQKLGFHFFNELGALCTFELGEEFFWTFKLVANSVMRMNVRRVSGEYCSTYE